MDGNVRKTETQEPEFETLMNDALFHMVFTNNNAALRGLVSSLLGIPEEVIVDIEILNPMQYMEAKESKLTVLDLKIHLNGDRYLNIEMQVRRFSFWANRTVVYSCRQITEQSNKEGFSYGNLEPVIHIGIMDHTLFPDHKRFFARYELKDEEGYPYTDKLQFYVMDLTAVDGATDKEKKQKLVEWANAFRATSWSEIEEINNSAIKEATKQMRVIMSTPDQRQIVWNRKLAEIDYRSQITEEREQGAREGTMDTLRRLVQKGRISVAEAAEDAGMTVKEFKESVGISDSDK